MKNVFTKFLLLAAVAGIFISCDKEEKEGAKKDPSNYIQIGSKKSAIVMGAMDPDATVNGEPILECLFFGEGLSLADGGLVGKGDMAELRAPNTPGEYSTDADASIGGLYAMSAAFAGGQGAGGAVVVGFLVDGSKIKWSKSGNVYTIDFEGNTILNDNSAGEFLKVHYVGELRDLSAELN